MKTFYALLPFLLLVSTFSLATDGAITPAPAPPTSKTFAITSATQALTVTGLTAGTYTFKFSSTDSLQLTATGPFSTTMKFNQTATTTSVVVQRNPVGLVSATTLNVTLPATLTITPSNNFQFTVSPPISTTAPWKGLPYDDAIQLNTLLNAPTFTDSLAMKATELFAYYYGKDDLTIADLKTEIGSNIYLKPLKDKLPSATTVMKMAVVAENSQNTITPQFSGLGAISPTVAIDVLGTFIARRFREEINAAYINRFRLALIRPDSLHFLVPETYKVLRYADPYNFTSFLQTLQESFDDDLRHLPFNTNAYMAVNRSKMVQLMKSPVLFDLTASTLHVVSEIQGDKDALTILNEIGNAKTTTSIQNDTLKNAVRLTSLLSRNVLITAKKTNGATILQKEDWGKLRNDSQLRDLFIGLIMERERKTLKDIALPPTVHGNAKVSLYNGLMSTGLHDKANQLLRYADTLSTSMANLKDIKSKLDKEKSEAAQANRKSETVGFTFSLIEGSVNALSTGISLTHFLSNTPVLKTWQGYIQQTRRLLPPVRYVFEKRYGMALSGVVTFLRELMPEIDSRTTAEADSAVYKYIRKQINDSQKVSNKIQKTAERLQKANEKLAKILSLSTTPSATKADYQNRVSNFTTVIDTLLTAQGKRTTRLTTGLVALGSPQTVDDSDQRCAIRNTLQNRSGELMKHGTFMVTVVESKTKDEMLLF